MALNALEPIVFVTIMILSFALFLLITGAFTAYFGSGKSRKIGAGLLVGGILIGVLWIVLRITKTIAYGSAINVTDQCITNCGMGDVVVQTIVVVLAVVIGAGLAIGLFLLAIMKS
jgi:hypothetical protein